MSNTHPARYFPCIIISLTVHVDSAVQMGKMKLGKANSCSELDNQLKVRLGLEPRSVSLQIPCS